MIVIVGCGKGKRKVPARADSLYIGVYFKKKLQYARTLTTDDQIFILSAKYGFIRLDQIIEPYELQMGDPGSITADLLITQSKRIGLWQRKALILASGPYIEIAKVIFADIKEAFPKGMTMLGQIGWLHRRVKEYEQKTMDS